MRKKVLFISHDASRTGAPYCLLHLLTWVKKNCDFEFEILLGSPGPLLDEFRSFAPTSVVLHDRDAALQQGDSELRVRLKMWIELARQLKNRLLKKIKYCDRKRLANHVMKFDPDLIYSNTIVNGGILEALSKLNKPVISHVHELDNIIKLFGEANWNGVKTNTSRFIAASNAVKQNLVANRRIRPDDVDVVYEFIPARKYSLRADNKDAFRKVLGVSENSFVVCGSGLDEWRKGTDLFIRCAHQVGEITSREVQFIWVGGWLSESAKIEHLELANTLGVADRIRFTGMVENPMDYYQVCDVFNLTSREDPFPLVCLEAASLGKPVICFADAGGMPDFVEDDAGFVVPFGDIESMASKIVRLSEDSQLRDKMGSRAQVKVLARHDINEGGRQIAAIISQELE